MWKFICIPVALLVVGCTLVQPASEPAPIPTVKKNDDYSHFRTQLINAGWRPIKASCGNSYMCLGEEFPELAMHASDATTSGLFQSGKSKLQVFTRPIADGELVESVQYVR